MAVVDPAALVAAAVRAACLAKAPRRTVQGVAAAVVSVLARPAELTPNTVRGETAKGIAASVDVLVQSEEERREAVKAKRRLKRQRKPAAMAASHARQSDPDRQTGIIGVIVNAANSADAEVTSRKAPPPNVRDTTGDTPPGKRFRDLALGLSNEEDGGAQERALAAASPSGSMQSCFSSREMSRLCTGFSTWYDAVLNSGVAHFPDGKTRAVCRSDMGEPANFDNHWITVASKRPALEHGSEWLVLPQERQLSGHSCSSEHTSETPLTLIAVFVHQRVEILK